MSLQISASYLRSPALLSAEEKPILALRITPVAAAPTTAAGGAGAAAVTVRRPFHLALLLDVSGSMEGARIASLKTTMHILINNLTADDRLTLIQYQSTARVLAEGRVMGDDRTELRALVDGLHADGGTNLEAALVCLSEVHAARATRGIAPIDAVFLLTDGHINQGTAVASGLLRILGAAVPAGTPVNALGYGAEHNAILLRTMATRTRGMYVYADAAEVLPATVGDIVAGLATEVGRQARLLLPDGWRCLEAETTDTDREYAVGTLIANKDQWVVLEGPAGAAAVGTAEGPIFHVEWQCGGSGSGSTDMRSSCTITEDIPSEVVAEQLARTMVAKGFARATQLMEERNLDEARETLRALGRDLEALDARDRMFVVQLRAQVDEMLESVNHAVALAAMPAALPALRGGPLRAGHALGGAGMPSMAPILSRMASNTAALSVQRGFLSSAGPSEDPSAAAPSDRTPSNRPSLRATFSSPAQQSGVRSMTMQYESATAAPSEAEDSTVP
jgi:hypothetical protein